MLRKTAVALAFALMLGGAFITTDAFAAEEARPGGGHPGGGHPGAGHTPAPGTLGTSGGAATAVADMAVHTVVTSVRLTGLAAAFQCRCQLLVAGNQWREADEPEAWLGKRKKL